MFLCNVRLHEVQPGSSGQTAKAFNGFPAALLAAALTLGSFAPDARADDDDDDEIPFAVAEVFVQLNDTDGDLGIHADIDGEAWKRLKIEDPRGKVILDIRTIGRLRRQGLTEIGFESAEPTFDELSPEEFFLRFPEGLYEIEARALEGPDLESEAQFTHVIPAPPVILTPAPLGCDEPVVVPAGPLTISWEAVTTTHPDIGVFDPDIEIVGYEITVEREEPAPEIAQDFVLPPDVTELVVPEALLALGTLFKVQVLVGEASGNETSSESCFEVAG